MTEYLSRVSTLTDAAMDKIEALLLELELDVDEDETLLAHGYIRVRTSGTSDVVFQYSRDGELLTTRVIPDVRTI